MNRFGFIKDAAQKAGKKMYGYGQKAKGIVEKYPEATVGGAGLATIGGLTAAGILQPDWDGSKQLAGEWLESQPELLQALKNEVGVMVIMKKGITEEMRSKFPGIDRMDMNPTRGNIQTITKYVDSNPKEMAIILDAFKKDFRGHLMSSVDNYVNILYNNATNRGM